MTISADAKPKLPRGVRLTHNEAQGGWVLLAPERVFKAEGPAHEIIKRCTGEATVNEIVDDLAKTSGRIASSATREPDCSIAIFNNGIDALRCDQIIGQVLLVPVAQTTFHPDPQTPIARPQKIADIRGRQMLSIWRSPRNESNAIEAQQTSLRSDPHISIRGL